jgi:hypothetical protein
MDKRKKLYYPQGQIQKGLYTQGKEWMLVDGTEYIGDYHRYTTGEVFTRSEWLVNISKKLIPYVNLTESDIKNSFEYDNLVSSKPSKFEFAIFGKQTPTEIDYKNGFYTRYFVKRYFQEIISELNKDNFETVSDEFYIKTQLKWKLTGPLRDTPTEKGVYDTNERLVLLAEKDMEGIRNYVTNYTEYARVSQ